MKRHVPDGIDADPFDLSPQTGNGSIGVLCLHGLTGTPYEVRPVAEELVARGMRCRGIVLAGHDGAIDELANTPLRQYLAAVREEIARLRAESQRVHLVGMSMGGMLSLMAASEGLVDRVAVIGSPLTFPLALRWGVPLMRYVRPYHEKKTGSDIQSDAARARQPGYSHMPMRAVTELMRLQRLAKSSLSKINVPILVAHGTLDKTAHPDDATRILAGVSSPVRELRFYPRSGHVVPVDHDGPALARDVADFLARDD